MKIMENTALFEFVVAKLKLGWSPQQISRALRREFPEESRKSPWEWWGLREQWRGVGT